ncbi:hypothetical protein Pint_31444 [Pistacia integerrima]|uniref:Uncharacterized protein n=1 Tax=Pistacia integerrima TaxID=434235 RepID=A0ACC0XPY8_9ROSI|nr:hypothetical protein Pint_31444 [Pistacia integerrima]
MSGNLSVDSFLHAVAGDLVGEVKLSVLRDPGLLDINYSGGSIGWKNPLEVACEHSSVRVAEEILSRRPELAKMKNGDGKVPMHIASEKGDERMVELLAKVSPEACLVEGFASMIPLHLAVIHGHSEVIKAIISTCPQSVLKKTSNQDTVLHLALKNSQLCTFYLLLSEVKKLNHLRELLNARDGEGNTILHIATSKKLIKIVKLLLVEGMEVCTQNYKGITVLDLCHENSEDGAYKKIRKILTDSKRKVFLGGFSLLSLSNSEVLAFTELITVACFTVLCNMPEPILKDVNLPSEVVPVMDFISGKLPSLFYILPLISTPFMTCTFLVGTFRWPTSDIARLLRFVWVCKCGVFILLVNKLTPKFSSTGNTFSEKNLEMYAAHYGLGVDQNNQKLEKKKKKMMKPLLYFKLDERLLKEERVLNSAYSSLKLISTVIDSLVSTVAASPDSNLLSQTHTHSLSLVGQSSLKLISTVAASPDSNLLSQTHTHLLSSVCQSFLKLISTVADSLVSTVAASPNSNLLSQTHTHSLSLVLFQTHLKNFILNLPSQLIRKLFCKQVRWCKVHIFVQQRWRGWCRVHIFVKRRWCEGTDRFRGRIICSRFQTPGQKLVLAVVYRECADVVLFLCVGECGLLNIVVVGSAGDFAKELALFGINLQRDGECYVQKEREELKSYDHE